MAKMFIAVLFLCQLLSIYGRTTPLGSALYKFTSADKTNTTKPGSIIFREQLGTKFMVETMELASDYIFKVLELNNVSDRKVPVNGKFYLEVQDEIEGFDADYRVDVALDLHIVRLSAKVAEREGPADRIKETIYHEMTHAWQWFGEFAEGGPEGGPVENLGLSEGIAEYVPLMAGFKNYGGKRPGLGEKWDEGYEVTAFFLDYCAKLKPGFVAELNRRLKYRYNDNIFLELLGKPVQDLWNDYKAKYAQ